MAERLAAKRRRRAVLGDITNRPVTADDASSGRGVCAHPPPCRTRPLLGRFGRALMPAPSLQAAASHASSSSGSPSMRSCCSSSSRSSYAACFGSVTPPPPRPSPPALCCSPARFWQGVGARPRVRSAARSGTIRHSSDTSLPLVRRSSAAARQPLVRSLRRTICLFNRSLFNSSYFW